METGRGPSNVVGEHRRREGDVVLVHKVSCDVPQTLLIGDHGDDMRIGEGFLHDFLILLRYHHVSVFLVRERRHEQTVTCGTYQLVPRHSVKHVESDGRKEETVESLSAEVKR